MWRIYSQLGAAAGAGARAGLPRPRLLFLLLRLHVLCGSGKTHNLRLVATGRADDRRTKLRRKLSKGWQPLKGCQKNGSELCLPYAKRVQVVVAVAVAVSVYRLGGEIDMQMHNVSHTVLWQVSVSVSVPVPVPGLLNVARI